MNNDVLSEKIASNSSTVIGNLIVSCSQLQIENEKLKRENTELRTQLNNLRKDKEVHKSEPRRYNPSNKQIRNKGIK